MGLYYLRHESITVSTLLCSSLLEVRAELQANLEFPNFDSNRGNGEWEDNILNAQKKE